MATQVKSPQISDYVENSSMARQAVMNGNFDIWQRGTTSATLADTTTYFTADRWCDNPIDDGGTLPTLTRTRQALTAGDIPNAFYYSRLTTNGAGTSLGVSSSHLYYQNIENGNRLLCGLNKKVTVSFWAKSDIANKKLGLYLQQYYGSGGSPTAIEVLTGTNWTLTSSWTKYTYTFTTNTLVGKTFGTANDDAITLAFNYIWGTTTDVNVGATTAETYVGSGNIDIAQVQLCAGDEALPFQPKLFNEELLLCQRYYENSQNYGTPINTASSESYWSAIAWDTNTCLPYISFKSSKRGTLTCNVYAYDGTAGAIKDQSGSNITGVTATATHQGITRLVKTGGLTAGRWYIFHWEAISEL